MTKELTLELLAELEREIFSRPPVPDLEPGDYVEYVNDDPETQMVQFCRKNGTVFMVMPVEVYRQLSELGK